MHPSSRIHEEERSTHSQYVGTTVIHRVPLVCAAGHCLSTSPFLVLYVGMAATKLPRSSGELYWWDLQACPSAAISTSWVEGRANLHISLRCKASHRRWV